MITVMREDEVDEQTWDDVLAVAQVELARAWLQLLWTASQAKVRPEEVPADLRAHFADPQPAARDPLPAFEDGACREACVARGTYRRARERLARLGLRVRAPRMRRDDWILAPDGAGERWRIRDDRQGLREGGIVVEGVDDPDPDPGHGRGDGG